MICSSLSRRRVVDLFLAALRTNRRFHFTDFVGQLKLVLKVIVDPLADLFNFLARQVWDRRLNFFDRADVNNLAQRFPMRREKLRAALKLQPASGEHVQNTCELPLSPRKLSCSHE
jgi:hypothetical protein